MKNYLGNSSKSVSASQDLMLKDVERMIQFEFKSYTEAPLRLNVFDLVVGWCIIFRRRLELVLCQHQTGEDEKKFPGISQTKVLLFTVGI